MAGGGGGWGPSTPRTRRTERTASCTTFTRVTGRPQAIELLGKYKDGCSEIPYVSEMAGSADSALPVVGDVTDRLRCTQPSRSGHSSRWALGPDRVLSTPREVSGYIAAPRGPQGHL